MDIGAYSQIESLYHILKSTRVDIPRLRGLRLMAVEPPFTQEDIDKIIEDISISEIEALIESEQFWSYSSNCRNLGLKTDRLKHKYLVFNKEGYPIKVRWDRIHGKKRKVAKYAIKQAVKRIKESTQVFNKYAGCDDVLCVHARIGGENWKYYGSSKITEHPAFLEKVDDFYDSTYCDIYLKIDTKFTYESNVYKTKFYCR